VPPLKSLTPDEKLIQLTSTATKYANKGFLPGVGGFSLHFFLECFLLFVVVGARNELRSTLLTLILISLKMNT
jgi:hypothetical protein